MVTKKVWKSLETFCHVVPLGVVYFTSSIPVYLKKSNRYFFRAIRYFVFFVPNAAALTIHALLKLLTIDLRLHLFSIHIAMLMLTTCASLFSYVFLYTVFGNNDAFFLHFNRLSSFQVKSTFGKTFHLHLIKLFIHVVS